MFLFCSPLIEFKNIFNHFKTILKQLKHFNTIFKSFKEFYKTILGGKTCNVGQICDFNGKLCNSDNKCWLPARIDNNSRIKIIFFNQIVLI